LLFLFTTMNRFQFPDFDYFLLNNILVAVPVCHFFICLGNNENNSLLVRINCRYIDSRDRR
jgi:hypothetical protein